VGLGTYEMPDWKNAALGKAPTFGLNDARSMKEQRESLPIFKLRDQLVQAVHDNQVLVVIGETGSGKTTQVRGFRAPVHCAADDAVPGGGGLHGQRQDRVHAAAPRRRHVRRQARSRRGLRMARLFLIPAALVRRCICQQATPRHHAPVGLSYVSWVLLQRCRIGP
jgi:hypothetical protein